MLHKSFDQSIRFSLKKNNYLFSTTNDRNINAVFMLNLGGFIKNLELYVHVFILSLLMLHLNYKKIKIKLMIFICRS